MSRQWALGRPLTLQPWPGRMRQGTPTALLSQRRAGLPAGLGSWAQHPVVLRQPGKASLKARVAVLDNHGRPQPDLPSPQPHPLLLKVAVSLWLPS